VNTENAKRQYKHALAILASLKQNVGQLGGLAEEKYVNEFNSALDKLIGTGVEISEFRIPTSELRQKVTSSRWDSGGDHRTYSKEKYVDKSSSNNQT